MLRILFIHITLHLVSFSLSGQTKYYPFRKEAKWGIMDEKGKERIPAKFATIPEFLPCGYAIVEDNDKLHVIDSFGNSTGLTGLDQIKHIAGEIYLTTTGKSRSIVKLDGSILFDCPYQDVSYLQDSVFLTHYNDLTGLYSLQYGEITKPIYTKIQYSALDRYMLTTPKGIKGIANSKGEIVIPVAFSLIQRNGNYYVVEQGKKVGFYTSNGKSIWPTEWDFYKSLGSEYVVLEKPGEVALGQLSTGRIISNRFKTYEAMSDSLFIVGVGGKQFGLIGMDGVLKVEPNFSKITPFYKNLYRVLQPNPDEKAKSRWGLVDNRGKIVLPCLFESMTNPDSTIFVVRRDTLVGVGHISGRIVHPLEEMEAFVTDNVLKILKKGSSEYIYYDADGNITNREVFKEVKKLKIRGTQSNFTNTRLTIGQNLMADTSDIYDLGAYRWEYDMLMQLWGLREKRTGNWKIEPEFDQVQVLKNHNFTIVRKRMPQSSPVAIRFGWYKYSTMNKFGIIHNGVGKYIVIPELLDIRLSDFSVRKLPTARVIFASGKHGLINKRGKIVARDYAYIGDFEDGYARATQKGEIDVIIGDTLSSVTTMRCYLDSMDCRYFISGNRPDEELRFRDSGLVVIKNPSWGVISADPRVAIPFQYEIIKPVQHGRAIVRKNKKWGMVSLENEELLPLTYDNIAFIPESDNKLVKLEVLQPRSGFLRSDGTIAVPVKYTKVRDFVEGLSAVHDGHGWGFVSEEGKEVVPCLYQQVFDFSEGLAAARLNGRWGFIDKHGNWVIQPKYIIVGNFKNGLCRFMGTSAKFGYMDNTEQVRIQAIYQYAYDFKDSLAVVRLANRDGLIDLDGKFVLNPTYKRIYEFSENGLAVVKLRKNATYALIDQVGQRVGKLRFQSLSAFKDGIARVRVGKKTGFLNQKGELVGDLKYSNVGDFNEGFAKVSIKGKWGYIDETGKEVIPLEYANVTDFQDGKAILYESFHKSALVDTAHFASDSLQIVKRLIGYNDGLALAHLKTKTGSYYYQYLDANGNTMLSNRYMQAHLFYHNSAMVRELKKKWQLITKRGRPLISPKYDKVAYLGNQLYRVSVNSSIGLANLQGKILLQPEYEYIKFNKTGVYMVEKGDFLGYVSKSGEWIYNSP